MLPSVRWQEPKVTSDSDSDSDSGKSSGSSGYFITLHTSRLPPNYLSTSLLVLSFCQTPVLSLMKTIRVSSYTLPLSWVSMTRWSDNRSVSFCCVCVYRVHRDASVQNVSLLTAELCLVADLPFLHLTLPSALSFFQLPVLRLMKVSSMLPASVSWGRLLFRGGSLEEATKATPPRDLINKNK